MSMLAACAWLLLSPNVQKKMADKHMSEPGIFIPISSLHHWSLDPLDADRHENLPVARMVYATPIEVSIDNRLTSQVLESFHYSSEDKKMRWKVKSDLHFSNGEPLTNQDIVLAISRMIYKRPKFPVISEIEGVEGWLKKARPLESLPSGIQLRSNNEIEIIFRKSVNAPLFRFALELFSIIPKDCIDLSNGRISCKEIPASGYYSIVKSDKNVTIFELRKDIELPQDIILKKRIQFRYKGIESISSLEDQFVANFSEYVPYAKHVNLKELGLKSKLSPVTDFISILISPDIKPFDKKECRHLFAKHLRKEYKRLISKDALTSASIFPPLIPGYLSNLENQDGKIEEEECLEYMKKYSVPWARLDPQANYFIDTLIKRTSESMGLVLETPIIVESGQDWLEQFQTGKSAFYPFMSGFWALDPVGDIKMLFTPGLHQDLKDIWIDPEIEVFLSEITAAKNAEETKNAMENLNRYLYEKGIMNTIVHLRRMYISRHLESLKNIPMAVQQPYPWQLLARKSL